MAKLLTFPGHARNPAAAPSADHRGLIAFALRGAPTRMFSVTRMLHFEGAILQVACNVRARDPVHAIGRAEDLAPFEGLLVGVTVIDTGIGAS